MNFVQTFYIDNSKDPFRDSFGWVAPEYHLMGWAFSCLQLHKFYGNITLFANSRAAHLLIDTMQLPYTEAHLSHDKLTLIHPDLWALPKIYTYSLQKQPFLHIDGDVFLFSQFNSDFLKAELIAQNVEVATEDYYRVTQKELMRYFSSFPPCIKKDFESESPFHACNAGILGGNNLSFFHEYADTAFDYIHKNSDSLKHIHVNNFNIFFEQHLFYALAKEKGLPVNVLFEGIVNDNGYKNMGDFYDVPFNRSYLHLLGHFKRDEFTCIQMAAKLRELYPNYYERIIELFRKKNLRISPSCFTNKISISTKKNDDQHNTHLQRLKIAAEHCPPHIEKELFQCDFETFYRQLKFFLIKTDSIHCFVERDVAAQHWYRDLFSEPSVVFNRIIVRCQEMEFIESSFDWAGLFNKSYRVGAGYYDDLQIERGHFCNLVIPEATDNGFSLYDINEIEHSLLLLLSEQLSIKEIFIKMQQFFDDDVLQNHYEAYENVILTSIKQLVIIKAIRPM